MMFFTITVKNLLLIYYGKTVEKGQEKLSKAKEAVLSEGVIANRHL